MADNIAITPGTGATVAADDIGGVLHQRVKLSLGADGTANDAGAGAGAVGTDTQRVTLASDDPAVTKLNGGLPAALAAGGGLKIEGVAGGVTVPVSGTFWQATQPVSAAALPLPTGAATEATVAAAATSLAIIDDWDESDRVKVNIVAGQAGITAGAGAVAANTPRVTLGSDDPLVARVPAALGLGGGLKVDPAPCDYETVAASATDQMAGGTGAIGDRLDAVLIIPVTTSPGAVSIEDGATNTVIFEGGASSVSNLIPFLIPMGTQGIVSTAGGWEITTGANVRAIAYGQFT